MYELELLIVIINYKTPGMLIDCLDSLIPELGERHHVVVVDNLSNDDSIERIEQWITRSGTSKVELIASPSNTGFSGGNNIGIVSREANYYLLLNSDTLVRKGAINEMLLAASRNTSVGLVSPRLEWPNGEAQVSCFKFLRPINELIGTARFGPITNLFSRWDFPEPISSSSSYPEWTSFACVLIRKEVINDIGLMDDNYFMYFEDTDYCRSAHRAGWSILNVPNSHVVHLRGGSSPLKKNVAQKARLPRYYYESRTRYFCKWHGRGGLLVANLFWYLGRLIASTKPLFGKQKPHSCEKQWVDIWINFLDPLRRQGPQEK